MSDDGTTTGTGLEGAQPEVQAVTAQRQSDGYYDQHANFFAADEIPEDMDVN